MYTYIHSGKCMPSYIAKHLIRMRSSVIAIYHTYIFKRHGEDIPKGAGYNKKKKHTEIKALCILHCVPYCLLSFFFPST